MRGFDRKMILERAFIRGGSMAWVDFLKSQAVAERIARDVRRHLQANGINLSHYSPDLVVVRPALRWVGTFTVEVRLPGIRVHAPGYEFINEERSDKAMAALRASVKPDDLATSWVRPPR